MNIRECGEGIHISGQISVADLPTLSQAGIRTVICNRPDMEVEEQLDFAHIQQAAAKYGITFHYIPVISASDITENNLNDMIAVLNKAERPLLAYCRSGTRSNRIFNLVKNTWKKNRLPFLPKHAIQTEDGR
ncbi:MAG: hypothetical protein JSC189_001124 [Candidatus Tokpelaia sp. JSC189]|nr:MAG: hypothetical protein JSC189_001124 [Candidatus Tokpelaia sp. JSC189]